MENEHGPFTEMIGAEREHAGQAHATSSERLLVHPTFRTVGSALRLLVDLVAQDVSRTTQGYALIPTPSGQAWNKLLKHGRVLQTWGRGELELEQSTNGRWRPIRSLRPMSLFAFPRAAGAFTLPLVVDISSELGWLQPEDHGAANYHPHPTDVGLWRYQSLGGGSYVLRVMNPGAFEAAVRAAADELVDAHRALSNAICHGLASGQLAVYA